MTAPAPTPTDWAALGFTWTTLFYLLAGLVGGLARVLRCHGVRGLTSRFAPLDLLFTAAGGVIFPYLVPTIITAHIPVLVTALFIAFLTYRTNQALVALIRKLGLMPPNGNPPEGHP